jgi:hypothetical protein
LQQTRIRQRLTEHILAVRDALPDRRFISVSQIDDIRGVGGDTFEDIAYTFEADATPPSSREKTRKREFRRLALSSSPRIVLKAVGRLRK